MNEVLGEEMNVDDQDDPAWIVAHRVACLDAPENSLEAVRLAAKNGAKWIEFDVSFSSDLIGVAFHDDTLERVTMTSGQVDSLTYTQLAELDLAHKHPLSASFNNVKIISVEQFVAECVDLSLKMIIDLKTWNSLTRLSTSSSPSTNSSPPLRPTPSSLPSTPTSSTSCGPQTPRS